MNPQERDLTVLFADVSGSTRIYELLGDRQAKQLIDDLLIRMSAAVSDHGGVVIKSIGDEIMARFTAAESAMSAACRIQEDIDALPPASGNRLSVRIGFHTGTVLLQDEDVFGDAVNVAARVTGLAKGRQVLTTEETVACLSETARARARPVDCISVKGRQREVHVHEITWGSQQDFTQINRLGISAILSRMQSSLRLSYLGNEFHITSETQSFLIGRSEDCHLRVQCDLASRQHARIELRRGKFVLIDQSTNGTWVRVSDGENYLRREEIHLRGTGEICLGDQLGKSAGSVIHFDANYFPE